MVKHEALKKNVKILSGFAFSSSRFNNDSLGLPLIRIRDVKRGYSDTYFDGEYNPNFLINNGDILIGMDGEFNVSRWNGGLALLNQRVCKIISADGTRLDEHYLLHYLPKQLKIIESNTPSVTVKHLSVTKINEIKIPLPSIEEQKYIAEILDRAEALKQKRQQTLKLADEFLRATFLNLFGDPITNPKGWPSESLQNLTTKIGSGATPRGGKDAYHSEGISLIRSLNIHDNDFRYKDLAFIDNEQAYGLKNVIVESEDVLLNITGASVCRCAMVPELVLPARVNQHVAILRANNSKLNPYYLLHFLTSNNYKKLLIAIATSGGATREALTKTQLEELNILTPPKTEQDKFEQIVKKVEVLKAKMQTSETEIEHLAKSLSQKAFRGELTSSVKEL